MSDPANNIERKNENLQRLLRQRFQSAAISFDLQGVVWFGSSAKGNAGPESDIDLLVVAANIPSHRQKRSREILEIKRLFPDMTMDILLMTDDEVQSNFRNHNPLFLDIAEDGVLVIDRDNTLLNAMKETRRYILERGIERVADGWRFPVMRGMPSYLSKVSNMDFAFAMLKDADRDHRIGQQLEEAGYFDKAVYHFQQAVEKSIKAVLACLGVFRRTHLVGAALRDVCGENRVPGEWLERLLLIAGHSEALEPDASLSRYPGIINDALWLPAEEYDIEDARAADAKSAETFGIAELFVREWFSASKTPPL